MKYLNRTSLEFLFLFICVFLAPIGNDVVNAALININTASVEELDTLPGIGEVTANKIIEGRPYASTQDISRVDGIGEPGSSSYEKIINLITVGEQNSSESGGLDIPLISSPQPETSASAVEFKVLKLITSGNITGVVGQPMEFRAETNSDKLNVGWVFGDGSSANGQVVKHIYKYPGEYIAVASVSNSGKRITSRVSVKIVPNSLSITYSSADRVEIYNNGTSEINLHGRYLTTGEKSFSFPEDTIIKAGQRISFPSDVTRLTTAGSVRLVTADDLKDTARVDNTREQQQKISEIYDQILALQIKQMELKKSEGESIAIKDPKTQQLASASLSLADSTTSTTTISSGSKGGWFGTVKRFFGFK